MTTVPELDKGENCDFCRLLREVQEGNSSVSDLLDDPIFIERTRLLVEAHSYGPDDTKELTDELRDKVWRYISGFIPDYTYDYGKFFVWLRSLTRECFYESLRDEDEDDDGRSQNLSSKNHYVYFEERDYNACVREFESCINDLPEQERLACMYYIEEGLSARETAERLTKANHPCTQESVLLWIRNGLKSFFPEAGGFAIDEIDRGADSGQPAGTREKSSSATKAPDPSVGNSSKH